MLTCDKYNKHDRHRHFLAHREAEAGHSQKENPSQRQKKRAVLGDIQQQKGFDNRAS